MEADTKTKNTAKVITRFAPSPTGLFHVGSYRTALFSYIYARQHGGQFILRIEDTDKVRSKKEYEDNIIDSLKWLGLEYDAFYRQSERADIHASYIQKLIDNGHAFISKETPKEPGGRTEVIRFKNPNKKVKWNDLIRGEIEFDTTDLGDFIIAKSMTEPVFHLVVVVDDHEAGVTHIIRGEDHISNTPRHILLYEALGLPLPFWAHLPLVLATDRSKLSKRKGALAVSEYRDRGYLASTMVNFMALLGWNPGAQGVASGVAEQEIFSLNELLKLFDLTKVQKSGAVFNEEKLKWMNKQYIMKLSDADFTAYATTAFPALADLQKNGLNAAPVMCLIKEKINSANEIAPLFGAEGELSFTMTGQPQYPKEALLWKKDPDMAKTKAHLKTVIDSLEALSTSGSDFTAENVKAAIWPYAEAQGKGNVLWPMRYALSGKEKSPDPFIMSSILGKETTLARLNFAYNAL